MSNTPKFSEAEHQSFVDGKRISRMKKIDELPKELRSCVHDYGLNIVNAFIDCGVKKERHIRHLVVTVLDEFSPTRGSYSSQGARTPYIEVKK